jgi:tyrosyl-tRNA synthetase
LSQTTVAQMLSRKDFADRYGDGVPIALHEFLYPIAQAYDSVAMAADVELGGSDQLFNFLLARDYQYHAGQPKQICMTTPILEGTDGVERMGKSKGNYIGLSEPASEQFGKLMSLPDEMLPRYAELAAFWPAEKVAALRAGLNAGTIHPMAAKKDLSEEIVTKYHEAAEARSARERFEATVQRGEIPADLREVAADPGWRHIADALVACGFATSKREAERLVAGGGVKLEGTVVTDPRRPWSNGNTPVVIAVGNRRFARIVPRPH